jgi:hypothetical protein
MIEMMRAQDAARLWLETDRRAQAAHQRQTS